MSPSSEARSLAPSQLALELATELPRLAIEPEWKAQPRLWGHSFHPMCSYLASFPAALAHAFIARYSRPGDVVLDPFSGRGTVPLQAAAEGRIGVGNDLNPFAHLLTAAKVEPATPAEARTRARPRSDSPGRAVAARWLDLADGDPGRSRDRRPGAGAGRGRPRLPPADLRPAPVLCATPSTSTTASTASSPPRITGILHGKSPSYLSDAHAEHVQHGAALRPRFRRPDRLPVAGAGRRSTVSTPS